MVCLVTPIKTKSDKNRNDQPTINPSNLDMAMSEENVDDKLKLRRLAGGSIVENPPLFSPGGDVLLLSYKHLIHVYSTTTGEWVRDLEGNTEPIVGISFELHDKNIVVAVTVAGSVVRWKWKSGSIQTKERLRLPQCTVKSFHFVALLPESSSVFITFTRHLQPIAEWAVFNTKKGQPITISGKLELRNDRFLIDVDNVNFHYVAAIQGVFLFVMNYKTGQSYRWLSANKTALTIVRVHPREEMIATGDEIGRIFLWRNIYGPGQPRTTLYHWHHTPISSISFTQSGTGFYSGGQEAVLVQWNIDRPDLKKFVPRMHALIIHIAVSDDNRKIAVCTADNGIQILDSQNTAKCMLQGFTYLYNDKTGLNKFPVGLKINPRTNTLALNGRVGHIQFYSTYTRRLLYNMDVVLQNQLSTERDKILYNVRITAATFNIDWMATVEEWNDNENSPEIRLKFWQFQKERQSYTLNTSIEGPHEMGVKAIEFSSPIVTENLLCATAGYDNCIKIWSLEDSDNIYKKGQVWYCTSRANYKNYTLECINFSHDGSLLVAAFQNVLCIYKSQTLQLKAMLSAPSRFTGIVQRIEISVPKDAKKVVQPTRRAEVNEKRKRTLELFKNLLKGDNEKLLEVLKKESKSKTSKRPLEYNPTAFNSEQQELLFKRIRSLTDLSLFQKIDLFQKLEIYCSVPNESRRQLVQYIGRNIFEKDFIEKNLEKNCKNLSPRNLFKAKYRLFKYTNRKQRKSTEEEKLISVLDLLNLNESYVGTKRKSLSDTSNTSKCNGFIESDEIGENGSCKTETVTTGPPLQMVANVKHVCFAAGEYAHLIVACTEHRVLIWDILTLRLQSVLRLSVDRIAVDPMTSLVSAFTTSNELYIFSPNAPMPIYHRVNIPKIIEAAWMPRRYPKSCSLNSDWQAISTLYFLTEDQELVYLAGENDADDSAPAISFMNEAQDIAKYSIFGAFAARQTNAKICQTAQYSNAAIGVPGQAAVKSLIEMAPHTMAPTHLLSANFIGSLLRVENVSQQNSVDINSQIEDTIENDNDNDDNEDSDIEQVGTKLKSTLLVKQFSTENTIQNDSSNHSKQIKQRKRLRKVLKEQIEVMF